MTKQTGFVVLPGIIGLVRLELRGGWLPRGSPALSLPPTRASGDRSRR
jgi:hypothetical protein